MTARVAHVNAAGRSDFRAIILERSFLPGHLPNLASAMQNLKGLLAH